MSVCLHLRALHGSPSDAQQAALQALNFLRNQPEFHKADRAEVHHAIDLQDPVLREQHPPLSLIELYFASAVNLDEFLQLGPDAVQAWFAHDKNHKLAVQITALLPISTDTRAGPAPKGVSYLALYECASGDGPLWVQQYLNGHVPLMARLPCLLALEVSTRMDKTYPTGWRQDNFLLRNKVRFSTENDLRQALSSDIRVLLRQHRESMPPIHGQSLHIPAQTEVWHR